MTKFQTYVLNASVAASTNSTRLGQELMEALPIDLYEKYAGGEYDCFYKESLVGKFLNEVYNDFQPKNTEVIVWSREPRYYQRQVILDCSIADCAGMTSAEFEEHIVEWVDVLEIEGASDEPNYDLENLEEVGDDEEDWGARLEAKLRAAERSDLEGVNDYY